MELAPLIAEHGRSVQRLCRTYEAKQEKANELNQEIWTAIWLSLPNFQERCSIRTWIFRVAHNTAISHVSKDKRTKTLISIEDLEGQILDDKPNLSQAFENKDTLQRIESLLLGMKYADRQVFWLYLEGYSQEEIADVTGLTPTHISTKISRVKKVLKTVLEKNSEGEKP